MKTKWMMMTVAGAAMLWTTEGMATSPGSGYPCKVSHFEENLKNARYIVVARLEKYLPDFKGEYRVIINLRGDILLGTVIIDTAIPLPENPSDIALGGPADPIGSSYIFLGEETTPIVSHYQCDGRFSASFKDEHGRPALDPIINYIIEGKLK